MTVSSLDFSEAELDEARRMNRQLRWAPRFRAPSRLGKMMIQTMLGAQAFFFQAATHAAQTVSGEGVQPLFWGGHTGVVFGSGAGS